MVYLIEGNRVAVRWAGCVPIKTETYASRRYGYAQTNSLCYKGIPFKNFRVFRVSREKMIL